MVTLHPLYPRYPGNFIMFGTGQLLTASDITNTNTQAIYGVWDKPANSTVFSRSNLQVQTLSLVTPATSGLSQNILTVTNNNINWASSAGWYLDLITGGQREITDPQLINGAYIATLVTPPANVCNTPYSSMLLAINYKTGGALSSPQIDINADRTVNSSDKHNGKNPVGVGLAPDYVSNANMLQSGNNLIVQMITQTGQELGVINISNSPRQSSWWQIK